MLDIETNVIQNRMEEVRRDLDEHLQDTVEGVREWGDWRTYVKANPWIFLGAAFVAGYAAFVAGYSVMRRTRFPSQPVVESIDERGDAGHRPDASNLPRKRSTRDYVLPFVGNLIARGVLSYVGEVAGRLVAKHTRTIHDDQPHT